MDYFRIQVARTGTLVVWTSGEVATELELLDTDGNPLPPSEHTSKRGASGAVDEVGVKSVTIVPNIASREVDLRRGDIAIARVRGKGPVGGFTFKSKLIIPGETNILRPFPTGAALSVGGGGYTVDLSTYFSPSDHALKYSATVHQPVPGVPLRLGITFSGSVMNILAAEDGPAYSGPVRITVHVSDPFGLFAVQVLDLEFTREDSSGNRRVTIEGIDIPSSGCVSGFEFSDAVLSDSLGEGEMSQRR